MAPEDNPADDHQPTKEEYEAYMPEGTYFVDDADGGRLAKKERQTLTHFVGPRMDICGRIIQRCTVCGAKLCDSENAAMPVNPDGSAPVFPTWPEGRVVRVTLGNPTYTEVLPDDEKLPRDACIVGGMV